MWYRKILAYREITDPKGQFTIHKHKIPGGYKNPLFTMNPSDRTDPTMQRGTRSKVLGPGHYTSQNKVVAYGYDYPYTRVEKLPMGTRILDYDKLDEVQGKKIQDAVNEKKNLNIDFVFPVSLYNFKSYIDFWELYPILVELGYDAIEYDAGRNFDLKDVLEDVKEDPNFIDPRRRKVQDKSSLPPVVKPKRYKRRLNKLKKTLHDNKNILIINSNIVTVPKLFQKERFRPETLTDEEKEILDKNKFTTSYDITKKIIESYIKDGKDWQNDYLTNGYRLQPFDLMQLVQDNVIDDTFDPRLIDVDGALSVKQAIELIENGLDSYLIIKLVEPFLSFEDFKKLFYVLKKLDARYAMRYLVNKFDYNDVDSIVFAVDNDLLDLPLAKHKLRSTSFNLYDTPRTIGEVKKLRNIGLSLDEIKEFSKSFNFHSSDLQELLSIGFDKKFLLNYFGNSEESLLDIGFTLPDIINELDFRKPRTVEKVISKIVYSGEDITPLWEKIKEEYNKYLKNDYDEADRIILGSNFLYYLQYVKISKQEILDTFLEKVEQPSFVINNIHNDELQKPENKEILESVENYEIYKNALKKVEKEVFEPNVLICDRCGYIFKSGKSYCVCGNSQTIPNLGDQNKIAFAFEKYKELVDLTASMPESEYYFFGAFAFLDNAADDVMDKILNFFRDWKVVLPTLFGKYYNDPKYLYNFTSLNILKRYIENAKSDLDGSQDSNNQDDDGTITLGDPDED